MKGKQRLRLATTIFLGVIALTGCGGGGGGSSSDVVTETPTTTPPSSTASEEDTLLVSAEFNEAAMTIDVTWQQTNEQLVSAKADPVSYTLYLISSTGDIQTFVTTASSGNHAFDNIKHFTAYNVVMATSDHNVNNLPKTAVNQTPLKTLSSEPTLPNVSYTTVPDEIGHGIEGRCYSVPFPDMHNIESSEAYVDANGLKQGLEVIVTREIGEPSPQGHPKENISVQFVNWLDGEAVGLRELFNVSRRYGEELVPDNSAQGFHYEYTPAHSASYRAGYVQTPGKNTHLPPHIGSVNSSMHNVEDVVGQSVWLYWYSPEAKVALDGDGWMDITVIPPDDAKVSFFEKTGLVTYSQYGRNSRAGVFGDIPAQTLPFDCQLVHKNSSDLNSPYQFVGEFVSIHTMQHMIFNHSAEEILSNPERHPGYYMGKNYFGPATMHDPVTGMDIPTNTYNGNQGFAFAEEPYFEFDSAFVEYHFDNTGSPHNTLVAEPSIHEEGFKMGYEYDIQLDDAGNPTHDWVITYYNPWPQGPQSERGTMVNRTTIVFINGYDEYTIRRDFGWQGSAETIYYPERYTQTGIIRSGVSPFFIDHSRFEDCNTILEPGDPQPGELDPSYTLLGIEALAQNTSFECKREKSL